MMLGAPQNTMSFKSPIHVDVLTVFDANLPGFVELIE